MLSTPSRTRSGARLVVVSNKNYECRLFYHIQIGSKIKRMFLWLQIVYTYQKGSNVSITNSVNFNLVPGTKKRRNRWQGYQSENPVYETFSVTRCLKYM